jgi:molybdopterin-guanine dinucleotide biosynthesis protein A
MARSACAVILAGGESRRFGSDKALAQFRGEPLIQRLVRTLRGAGFGQLAIVAKDVLKYEPYADITALVPDVHPVQTPLAGLEAGLRASRYPLVFACAADMPFAADEPLIDALTAAIEGHDAAIPHAGGSMQPLCAMWRRDPCLRVAEELLARPRPVGPRAILPLVRTAKLDWGDIRPFLDADTPAVLRELELGAER